jgi:hypothetical protein
VAVSALDNIGRSDSVTSSQHSRQADSATSSLYSRHSTASASTSSYQSRVDTHREAPRSLELHDALHSLGEALNLASSASSSSVCAVENADYNKVVNQTRDNTTVNKCGNGKGGAYNSNAMYGSSGTNGVYSLSSSRSSSTASMHTSSTAGVYGQSVIIVFITLQNQSAPSQMTMYGHLLYSTMYVCIYVHVCI